MRLKFLPNLKLKLPSMPKATVDVKIGMTFLLFFLVASASGFTLPSASKKRAIASPLERNSSAAPFSLR